MAINFLNLPALQDPGGYNFEPLGKGFDAIREGRKDNRLLDIKQQAQDLDKQRFGLEQDRWGTQKKGMELEQEATFAKRFGGVAQMWLNEKDPTRQAQMFQQFSATDPRIGQAISRSLPKELHNDPVSVGRYLTALAAGYQDPLDREAKRVDIDKDRQAIASSAATNRRADEMHPLDVQAKLKVIEASKIGQLDADKELYIQDKTAPNGVRFIERPGGGNTNPEFRKAAAKQQAEGYGELVKHGTAQGPIMSDLETLSSLSKSIGGPGSTAWKQAIGPIAGKFGITISGLSDIEAFQSIINRVAPNMRAPGSGATSDLEFKGFLSALPALSQTSEGRQKIIATMGAMAQYNAERGRISAAALAGTIPAAKADEMLQNMPSPTAEFAKKTKPSGADIPTPRISSDAEFDALPSGTRFIDPNGRTRTKP